MKVSACKWDGDDVAAADDDNDDDGNDDDDGYDDDAAWLCAKLQELMYSSVLRTFFWEDANRAAANAANSANAAAATYLPKAQPTK